MKQNQRERLIEVKRILKEHNRPDQETVLFVTICDGDVRGIVWRTSGKNFERAWEKVYRYLDKMPRFPRWVRIELQTTIEVLPASECIRRFARTKRNNYFMQGISFKKDGSCSFLPEEISGNALLVPIKGHKVGADSARLQLNLSNIKGYIKRRFARVIADPLRYFDEEWGLFDTRGVVLVEEQVYPLDHLALGRGMRKIEPSHQKDFLKLTIEAGMDYLFNQINADGSFTYGYFPAYHKLIPGYNSVRHFSSLYALLETIEYAEKQGRSIQRDQLLTKIETSLDWGFQNLCISRNDHVFVAEQIGDQQELKLGAQAVAILALAKYEELTGNDFYHQLMVNLLEGIEAFIDEKGMTTHVLAADLTVKEAFRIVYYDGEALFAIMRAYPLTKDPRWLQLGERLMDRFVSQGYEKFHDHWLSYSVNELTQYLPKRSYFEFGVKNALQNLAFMENRDTAYPTFLELLCAANKMFQRIQQSEFADELFTEADEKRLWTVTEKRALHEMRTGVMWPEYAMFFARPTTIAYGFYARHDRTRMRIDDAEHFLSGLINYAFLAKNRSTAISQHGVTEKLEQRSLSKCRVVENVQELFAEVTGYFWPEGEKLPPVVTDFEYYPSKHQLDLDQQVAFIDLSDQRLQEITGKAVKWPDRRAYLKNHFDYFSLLITEEPFPELQGSIPQFIVPNTWEFMYELATLLRQKFSGPVVAITGSVGKSSLRLMLDHLLGTTQRVLSNRGNHNTRLAIPLYLTKLVQAPDIVNLEVSLNALNSRDRGPQGQLVKPTIAILTSVDYAHMTGVKDLALMAKIKSRIFEGLQAGGTAIYNQDLAADALAVVAAVAQEKADRILTYSMQGKPADLRLMSLKKMKYLTEVTVQLEEKYYTYYLEIASEGMVENSLAALLALYALEETLPDYLPKFADFRSLPKVMALHSGHYQGKEVDIIDDTHNAAIPSMLNAIRTFRDKGEYYPGSKILALGQVADLGEQSLSLHESLVVEIDESGADCLLAYGPAMKAVASKTRISAAWFDDLDSYEQAILQKITDQSLLLMKGSVSGSDFNQISGRILQHLKKS